MSVEITAADPGSRMSITTTFPSAEAMEQLVSMGMDEGMSEALGQIDGILAEARDHWLRGRPRRTGGEGQVGLFATTTSVSPGQSQKRPEGETRGSSARASRSKSSSRSPNRCGADEAIERQPSTMLSMSRTTSGRPGANTCRAGAEPRPSQDVLVAVGVHRPEPASRSSVRTQIPGDQFLELIVRDERMARIRWHRASFDDRRDECDRAARLEHVEHRLDGILAIRPMERLAERDESKHPEVESAGCSRRLPGPTRCCGRERPAQRRAFGQHVLVGVEADRVDEVRCQFDRQDARTAPDVEQAPSKTSRDLLAQHAHQVPRVGRTSVDVVAGRASIDRGVVRHPAQSCSGERRVTIRRYRLSTCGRSSTRIHANRPARRNSERSSHHSPEASGRSATCASRSWSRTRPTTYRPSCSSPTQRAEAVASHEWLVPDFADDEGRIGLSVQAFVVETPTRNVVVDPCVGKRQDPRDAVLERAAVAVLGTVRGGGLLRGRCRRRRAHAPARGSRRVGHATRRRQRGCRHSHELATSTPKRRSRGCAIRAATTTPTCSRSRCSRSSTPDSVTWSTSSADLGEGLRLAPSNGHTPGHVSLWIESDDQTALLTGDFFHHPVQCAVPEWAEVGDSDPDEARATRRRMLDEAATHRRPRVRHPLPDPSSRSDRAGPRCLALHPRVGTRYARRSRWTSAGRRDAGRGRHAACGWPA